MKESILADKSYTFAKKMVELYKHLSSEKKEFILSKQCLRSGTSIGASIREAGYAQSKPDFINKLSISLKEANETYYWLSLLKDTGYLTDDIYNPLVTGCEEIIKILVSSILTAKRSLKKNS